MPQADAITLPWPPSVNHYWRHVGSRVLISHKGRLYRQRVAALWIAQPRASRDAHVGRLAVSIRALVPDRRARDLDNLLKSTLDALTHAGAWGDDSQIDELNIKRVTDHDWPGGCIQVTIAEPLAGRAETWVRVGK